MDKLINIIDRASKIGVLFMGVFLPIYILFHLLVSCENTQTAVCDCMDGRLIVEEIKITHIDYCDTLCAN